MHRLGDFGRSVPSSQDDKKNVVYLGGKTYVFMSPDEAKDFMHLVRIKHIYADDAYARILKLRKEGHYGSTEEEPPMRPDERRSSNDKDDENRDEVQATDEPLFG